MGLGSAGDGLLTGPESPSYKELLPQEVFPGSAMVKNPPASEGDAGGVGLIPGWGRCPGAGNGKSVFLPGQRRLVSYSPWGHKESEVTEYACMQPLSIGLLSA